MKTIKPLPPIEELRELLHYEPDTGLFRWKLNCRGKVKVGSVAGTSNGKGYIAIRVNGEKFVAHRLAWALYYNQDPGAIEIDHIDKNKSNNKIINLRLASHKRNGANSGPRKNNKLGVKGVQYENGKFRAGIEKNGKQYYLGCYDTIEEASNVYWAVAEELYGEFAHEKCKHPEKLTEYACKYISKAIGRPYGAPKLDRNGQFMLVI
jgi:hypothetical protein